MTKNGQCVARKRSNVELVAQYAAVEGLSVRSAQRHRRGGDARWVAFLASRGDQVSVEMVLDQGGDVGQFSPLCHAQMIYDEAFREWQACVERVRYVRDPENRNRVVQRVDLPQAQKAVNVAVVNMDKARELLQAAQLADGRLVDRGSLVALERGLAQVFAELNKLPSGVAGLFGIEESGRVEALVYGVIEDRIKPVMESIFNGCK